MHAMICATIWKECNRRVFENLSGDPSSVWESFLFFVASWAKKDIMLFSFSFESIRCNLHWFSSRRRSVQPFINEIPFFLIKKKNKKRRRENCGFWMAPILDVVLS